MSRKQHTPADITLHAPKSIKAQARREAMYAVCWLANHLGVPVTRLNIHFTMNTRATRWSWGDTNLIKIATDKDSARLAGIQGAYIAGMWGPIIAHELIHVRQGRTGDWKAGDIWNGNTKYGAHGSYNRTAYRSRPWEKEAYGEQAAAWEAFKAAHPDGIIPIDAPKKVQAPRSKSMGIEKMAAILTDLYDQGRRVIALADIQGLPASAKYPAFWRSVNNSGRRAADLAGLDIRVRKFDGLPSLVIEER